MKKIFQILGLVSCMVFVGCENYLTNVPQDTLTADNYYTSERAIEQNCYSLYAAKTWSNFQMSFMWMAGDELAGDMFYTYDQEGQFYYASFGSNNAYLTQGWKGLYRVISFANNIINDMPAAARANDLSEAAIEQGVAQARCVRAIAYYFLTEYWGAVTIVEDNLSLMSTPLYRHTQDDVYRFIVEDLLYAERILPAQQSVKGMATKWTAKGMLAKVYLTMASHLDNPNSATYFAQAKAYAKDVIENSGLQLYPDYSTLFDIEANNCDESLFAIQNMVAGYAYGNSRNAHWSRDTRISDVAWGQGKGPTISLQESYTPDDQRRQWVYMTLGDYYPNLNKAEGGYTYQYVYRDPVTHNKLETSNEMLANLKKYVIGKSADTNGGVGDQQDAANNTYLLRLADVYMVYVEACIGAGDRTDDALALQVFNRVHHDRAGLPEKTTPITYDELIKERRCEFALEGINFFDIKRMFYRNENLAIRYLNRMERHRAYYDNGSTETNENVSPFVDEANSPYELNPSYEPILISKDQMYLPVPGSEITSSPTLAEDPVKYYQD